MTRRHDIDALRALAFSLLILYHLGMLYVPEWGWHIKSSYQFAWLEMPMLMLNRWRMDLIFLISGVSTAFLMRSDASGRFLGQRSWRLLLPLLFGMLVVVPIQPYCQGVANGLVEPGFVRFLGRYYSGYAWPAKAFDGWEHGFTWNHLWYLAYLWCYTVLLWVLQPALNSQAGERMRTALTGLGGARLLVWPAVPLMLYTVVLQPFFPDTHDLTHDWYLHAVYFTVFMYGWLLARSDALWHELARLRKPALWGALGAGGVYLAMVLLFKDATDASPLAQTVIWALRNAYIWLVLCSILGWGHTYLNKPFRWLPWATQAVYPWYILHQSLIVLLAYWVVPLQVGALAEPVLVGVGTVVGCWLLTSVVISRVAWLRPCFGLKPAGKLTGGVTTRLLKTGQV